MNRVLQGVILFAVVILLTFIGNVIIIAFGLPNNIVAIISFSVIVVIIGQAIYINEFKSKKRQSKKE